MSNNFIREPCKVNTLKDWERINKQQHERWLKLDSIIGDDWFKVTDIWDKIPELTRNWVAKVLTYAEHAGLLIVKYQNNNNYSGILYKRRDDKSKIAEVRVDEQS